MNESRDKWMNVFDKLLQFFKAPWVVRAPPLSHANPQCHLWCLRWQVLSSGRVFHRKSSWHLPNLCSHPFSHRTLDPVIGILMDFTLCKEAFQMFVPSFLIFYHFCSLDYPCFPHSMSKTAKTINFLQLKLRLWNFLSCEIQDFHEKLYIWHQSVLSHHMAYCTLRQRHENHHIMIRTSTSSTSMYNIVQ